MVAQAPAREFTLEDYRDQLGQVRKMGSLDQVLSMIPGMGSAAKDVDTEARRAGDAAHDGHHRLHDAARARASPSVINGSRRKRIAKGSGTRSRT